MSIDAFDKFLREEIVKWADVGEEVRRESRLTADFVFLDRGASRFSKRRDLWALAICAEHLVIASAFSRTGRRDQFA
jgi:hypothetical protein